MAGEIVEQLDHQIELSEPLCQVPFVGLILLEIVVQTLRGCEQSVLCSLPILGENEFASVSPQRVPGTVFRISREHG